MSYGLKAALINFGSKQANPWQKVGEWAVGGGGKMLPAQPIAWASQCVQSRLVPTNTKLKVICWLPNLGLISKHEIFHDCQRLLKWMPTASQLVPKNSYGIWKWLPIQTRKCDVSIVFDFSWNSVGPPSMCGHICHIWDQNTDTVWGATNGCV